MEFIFDGPEDGPLFLFAHGAGASCQSQWMENMAKGLAKRGIRVARFNFPYMQIRMQQNTRRPPDRAPKLVEFFKQLILESKQPVFIGGKSMGGRIASMVAALGDEKLNSAIKGVICLGYPFHPQAKPEKLRIEHLHLINADLLICQGTRDKLGSKLDVVSYGLSKNIDWCWLEDGDHDFKPRVKSGLTLENHLETAMNKIAYFVLKSE